MIRRKCATGLIAVLAALSACGPDKAETRRNVEQLMASEITLPEACGHGNYYIVRYIRPRSCTSCELEMGKWRVYKRRLQNRHDDVRFFFVIETKNVGDAENLISIYKFADDSFVDTCAAFIKENPLIEKFGNELVMLMDSTRAVMAVGDPVNNPEAYDLFERVISSGATRDTYERSGSQ